MSFSNAVLYLAIAGAIASWIVAVVYFVRTLAALGAEDRRLRWRAMVAWLSTVRHFKGAAAIHAAMVHKAMLVFFVCLLAVAALSIVNTLAQPVK